ncbi:MAG: DEAD/DEAH box helicase [Verrucomicrobia bacterium]|nr:DEAD/DEAH box helicase [Verrucomicrobiota bacterium]
MLRFHLPPNLASAAPRDAIALKVDLDLSAGAPPAEIIPALVLLQRWSGAQTPPKIIQINRARMRDLVAALKGQPVFYWVNGSTPIAWNDDGSLSGVSIFLAPPASAARPTPPPTPRVAPRPAGTRLGIDGSEHFLAVTLPSREDPSYNSVLTLLKENGFVLDPSSRTWWLRDRHKTLNFLAAHLTRLRDVFLAEFTPNFEKNTKHLRPAEIGADIAETGDSFAVTLSLRVGSADESTLRTAVATNRGYLESDGKVFLFDKEKLQKLATAQRALSGDPTAAVAPRRTQRVSSARIAEAQDILEELSPGFQPPESWRVRSSALKNLSALAPAPVPPALDALFRPYQRLGAAWLWHLYRHQLGGILADEMGLGKTMQALALLSAVGGTAPQSRPVVTEPGAQTPPPALRRTPSLNAPSSGSNSPRGGVCLVVCPASLLENWRRESARFAPQLRTFVHHSSNRLETAADFAAHDLIITSYGTLARDQTLFTAVEFACVIADEAQHIKNRRSQNASALRALRSGARFLLTGTPLENSLDDLRSLFEFLLPGYLTRVPGGLRGDERAWFDERLRAQTAPYILRRTKRAVAPELPEKLEQTVWCELTPAQAKLYRDTQEKSERELFDLEAGGASETKLQFAALTQLLRLRQICCDPRLVETEAPADHSAKLESFREILAEALDDGHRLLVFSQFTSLLALLRAELDEQAIAYSYLDGSMSTSARQTQVDRFQNQSAPDAPPVFLLSLKAGGTGLNLTAADTVVHFDPWWNPAAEAQATDRAHRIGQTRVVTSYKLVASGTVEEKVLALQDEKRALLANVFEASDAAAARLSLADLKSLLK